MELRNDLKVGELVLITSDTKNNVGIRTYWGENTQSAIADMNNIWSRNKGDVVYLFRLERIVQAQTTPRIMAKPVERVQITLEKENNEWSVENV
jgi:hypothetical protein